MYSLRVMSNLKNMLVRPGQRAQHVLLGLNRGLIMHLDLRDDLQRKLGIWEREIAHVFAKTRKEIHTAVDVGAGDGFYTLFLLAKTTAKRVFAFEPSREASRLLQLNLVANNMDRDRRLVLSAESVGAIAGSGSTTLGSLAGEIKTPCLIKIDVEGAEVDVLFGAEAILSLQDIIWVIETHSRELEQQCEDCLAGHGYDVVIVPNARWRSLLPELRPIPHNRWIVARRPI